MHDYLVMDKTSQKSGKNLSHDFFKSIPLFSDLTTANLNDLAKIAKEKSYPKNNRIIHEGDPGDALYLIDRGRVKVTLYGEDGKEVILDILNNGDYFGEMSLLDGKPRSANVVTIDNSTFFVIYRDDFTNLIKIDSSISMKLLEHLSLRVRKTNKKIGNLLLLDLSGRIANVLIELAGIKHSSSKKEIYILDMPSQQEFASMIGASREAVNRAFKAMEKDGYIKVAGNKIILGEYITSFID